MMMGHTLHQSHSVAGAANNREARTDAPLLISHTDRTVVDRIGITVRWIQQIKLLLGEIQPAVLVEIFGVVFPDSGLHFALPRRNNFMERFGGKNKIKWCVISLLMIIHMYLGQPLVI